MSAQGHDFQPITRMSRDIAAAAAILSDAECRFLVDAYYTAQEDRKRGNNQARALESSNEPNAVLVWMAAQNSVMEQQVKRALDKYTEAHPMGSWLREIKGIGPVISAGLLAHIDITKAPTAGHIWRYAGLDPTQQWISKVEAERWVKQHGLNVELASRIFNIKLETLQRMATTGPDGESIKLTETTLARALCRRPWNATLRTLLWKSGQSFMKLSNDEDCYYGQVYRQRKAYEIERNESGGNADAAKRELETKNYSKSTEAYRHLTSGKLPPAQIDARARRYAVKRFVADLQVAWYWKHYGILPPRPYVIDIQRHAHWEASAPLRSIPELYAALLASGAQPQ